MMCACLKGHEHMVETLLRRGATVDMQDEVISVNSGSSSLDIAKEKGSLQTALYRVQIVACFREILSVNSAVTIDLGI